MNNLIKENTMIVVSLFLFSISIGVVIYLSQIGYSLLSIGDDNRAFKQELALQRELSHYEDKLMTRDDVLIAVKKYTKEYNILIQPDLSTNDKNATKGMTCDPNDLCLNVTDLDSKWNLEGISKTLEKTIEGNKSVSGKDVIYHSKIERSKTTGEVIFLTFTIKK